MNNPNTLRDVVELARRGGWTAWELEKFAKEVQQNPSHDSAIRIIVSHPRKVKWLFAALSYVLTVKDLDRLQFQHIAAELQEVNPKKGLRSLTSYGTMVE